MTNSADDMRIIRFTIPEIPPSNNRYIGRNMRWAYREEKARWEALILGLAKAKPRIPCRRAAVTLRYFFPDKRRRDPDNYSGKMILDGLVKAGILQDDSFDHIRLNLEKGGCDRQNPRTEITIQEVHL